MFYNYFSFIINLFSIENIQFVFKCFRNFEFSISNPKEFRTT